MPSPHGAPPVGGRIRPAVDSYPAIVIEDVSPEVDGGRWPAKRAVGDRVQVSADAFKEGHDLIQVRLLYRREHDAAWHEAPMEPVGQDRFTGAFIAADNTRYRYTVEAFTDVFGSWAADLRKRVDADQDVSSELLEGKRLVLAVAERAAPEDRAALEKMANVGWSTERALAPETEALLARYPDRTDATRYDRELELIVDRVRARFAAWYELFPRSQGTDPTRSATFREAEARLPAIAEMGFDVVYMPPIHPIGRTNRKGRNNSLTAEPGDPGSPYAIGGPEGGHTAVHPDLGTLDDFLHFQQAARSLGMELAMDFAIQVSPDHPWVKEHPEWFYHRPDGTIKFAENPPKKYEDIYPLNFRSSDWKGLWAELLEVMLFWAERGVRIFRVDNPHTKPLAFWQWAIRAVQDRFPDAIFLAEAFTRPKMMRVLGKAGFTQSYTYFTWRNTAWELREYLTELTQSPMREYYRGNFFANTPDILPHMLQLAGRPAFRLRLLLAATLSSVYGIYNGYELCENTPRGVPGQTEYYADSEMYQFKVWDWDRPGNIVDDVRRINRARQDNPALHLYDNLRFHWSENDQILVYSKATPDLSNVILATVNTDPYNAQAGWVESPIHAWGLAPDTPYVVEDLLTGAYYTWTGPRNWVRLQPSQEPGHLFRVHLPSAAA